jgi:hypothetical protein
MSEASARPEIPEPPLRRYEANVASQCGEDGVIARALELIGTRDRWCVEFGAWDGRYASNSYRLIAQEGYRAVLIEADPERCRQLARTHADRPEVIVMGRLVGFEGPERLDRILAETPIPTDFDVLSIDIDGNDYHVWEALREYRPKLVVIEFNPTIPNEVEYVQPRDPAVSQGSSLQAIDRLARGKGYRLIHATVVNGIFVEQAYAERFELPARPSELRADLSQVSWMFQTYDGRIHVAGYDRARWHDVGLDVSRMQVVPRALRGFPPGFGRGRSALWRAWRLWRRLLSAGAAARASAAGRGRPRRRTRR